MCEFYFLVDAPYVVYTNRSKVAINRQGLFQEYVKLCLSGDEDGRERSATNRASRKYFTQVESNAHLYIFSTVQIYLNIMYDPRS